MTLNFCVSARNNELMRLVYAARGAASAYRARERMARTGRTPKGHWLWTKREDDIVRALYPDYRALRRKLRRRTYYSLRARARTLDIVKRRHVWLGTEVTRLRRLYPKAERHQLQAAFPDVTWSQIKAKAQHVGIHRARKKLVTTGYPIIDLIRDRAFELNLSMVDVDAMAGTKRYFQKACWVNGNINRKAMMRAVEALGGEVSVSWQ
ncbi:MAG: hypothetical protein AB7U75_07210 [Hyphomicrobiaceae bacterium]